MKQEKSRYIILCLFTVSLAAWICPVFPANYTISVNAGTRTGRWNKFYEKAVASDHMYTVISSAYGRNISNALKKGHDEAGFQYVRGHGILDSDVNVYSETGDGAAVYNWANFDKIIDSIIAAGMRPIVEIGFMPPALAGSPVAGVSGSTINNVWYNGVPGNWCAPKDWNKWEALVKALISHVETKYGAAEVRNNWFFELWNEPNWMYGGGGGLEGYKTLYNHTSAAVKAQDALVRLGGPAESGGSTSCCLSGFISYCKTNNCKLDFVSYHNYANDAGQNCDPTTMIAFYKTNVVDVCKANNFTGLILNTEWGPSYTAGVIPAHDAEMAASFAVKTVHLLNLNDTTAYPPPYSWGWWALSDIYEEVDNRGASPAFAGCYGLLCRGVPNITQSWDVAKPAFNAYKLMHRLNDNKVSCTGGTTASPGVNAIATISGTNDTISNLVYSHVDNTNGNPATTDNVMLNVTMPAGWTTSTRMEHWVVDHNHSNSYQAWVGLGSPANPGAADWTTINSASQLAHYDSVAATITLSGNVYSKTFTVNYYSVGLIQLTRATTGITNQPVKTSGLNGIVRARLAGNVIKVETGIVGTYEIALYSVNGQRVAVVHADGPGTNAIRLHSIPAGAYMLECTFGQSMKTGREIVVVNRNQPAP